MELPILADDERLIAGIVVIVLSYNNTKASDEFKSIIVPFIKSLPKNIFFSMCEKHKKNTFKI